MPRKKSLKKSADDFKVSADEILNFLTTVRPSVLSEEYVSWLHNYAIIRLYKAFETLMLDVLVAAINNDTSTISNTTGVAFPKHLNDEVCEFIITGTGYFDFKARSGLIKTLKGFVPDNHYVVKAISDKKYQSALDQLSALRNFAAHESASAKRAALKAIDGSNLSSSGAWLKKHGRLNEITDKLKALAIELKSQAPY
jgi:cupin superfamily acireductone dioxygenase involved in methionine salvage